MLLKSLLQRIFNEDKRSKKAYVNIVAIGIIKLLTIAIGIVKVPLLLKALDPTRYGIWITITVILNWFSLFDIGFGKGLRNRLAESLALGDYDSGKEYVSTTYAAVSILFTAVFICFMAVNPFLDWTSILNAPPEMTGELGVLVLVVFLFFCGRFIAKLIETVANAHQEPWIAQIAVLAGNFVALVCILLLLVTEKGNLFRFGLAISAAPVLTYLILSLYLFRFRYTKLVPSFRSIRLSRVSSVMSLGIKFFVVQIATIVFYQTNVIIVAQLFGPEEVTPFQIGFQYFNYGIMGFMIILTPYWTAITDAYARGEFKWIKRTVRNLRVVWLFFVVIIIFQYLLYKPLIKLWVGDSITVPFSLMTVLAVYFCFFAYNNLLGAVISGTGKMLIQMWRTGIMSILHIPLTIVFAKNFGISGVMYAMLIWSVITVVLSEYQYRLISNERAFGIWGK